jgi:hypothetical protein
VRGRIALGTVVAVIVAIVLAWTLSDGPPRPHLVPTTATPPVTSSVPVAAITTVYRPAFLPAGFVLVGERGGPAGQIAASTGAGAPVPVGDAYLLHYERPRDGGPDSLDVLTVQRPDGTDDGTTTSRAVETQAETTVVQVHGHEALQVTTTLPGPVRLLTWTEAPGLQLRVVATGQITEDELRQVAESLAAA